jgi:hypothetical protein
MQSDLLAMQASSLIAVLRYSVAWLRSQCDNPRRAQASKNPPSTVMTEPVM